MGKKDIDNKKTWICRNINLKNIVYILITSFCLAFVYGYIIPLDIMLNNQPDFLISFFDISKNILTSVIMTFIVVFVVELLTLIINKYFFALIMYLIVGATLASYIQELFMNGYMIRGESDSFVGELPHNYEFFNMYIYILITILPVGLVLFGLLKSRKNKQSKIYMLINKISLYIISAITIMRFTGFVFSYISFDPHKYSVDKDFFKCASYEPTLSFSKENNVYVFIVDTFDSFWCDELLEEYPELCEELDGFTFYMNNISHYTNTFPSIPSMLTCTQYDNSEWLDYFNQAWSKDTFLSDLKNDNYKINMILEKSCAYGIVDNIENVVDNFEIVDDKEISVNKSRLRKILYRLMCSRILPYYFKNVFNDALYDIKNSEYYDFTYEKYSPPTIDCYSDC